MLGLLTHTVILWNTAGGCEFQGNGLQTTSGTWPACRRVSTGEPPSQQALAGGRMCFVTIILKARGITWLKPTSLLTRVWKTGPFTQCCQYHKLIRPCWTAVSRETPEQSNQEQTFRGNVRRRGGADLVAARHRSKCSVVPPHLILTATLSGT